MAPERLECDSTYIQKVMRHRYYAPNINKSDRVYKR